MNNTNEQFGDSIYKGHMHAHAGRGKLGIINKYTTYVHTCT